MRALTTHVAILTAALGLIAATPATVPGTLSLREGSKLWFEGTSTVRSWNCTADRIDATLSASDDGAIAAVLDGRKVAGQVQVDFPVQKLECKNGTMNEHMWKALKAKEFATIRFTLDSYDLARATDVTGTLRGTLQLAGQTLPVTIPAQFAPATEDAMRVTGKVPVKMTDWGIKPPSLMLGAMKVGPVVTVHFDLLLQKGGAVVQQ